MSRLPSTGGKARKFNFVFGNEDTVDRWVERSEADGIERQVGLCQPGQRCATRVEKAAADAFGLVTKAVAAIKTAEAGGTRIDGLGGKCKVEEFAEQGALAFDEFAVDIRQIDLPDVDAGLDPPAASLRRPAVAASWHGVPKHVADVFATRVAAWAGYLRSWRAFA